MVAYVARDWIVLDRVIVFPIERPSEHECGLTGNALVDSKALV